MKKFANEIYDARSENDVNYGIKYNVNEEDRIVTAYRMRSMYLPICKDKTIFDGEHLFKVSMLPDKLIGIAKCHPDDEFDVELGKKIAKRKLEDFYYGECVKRLHEVKKFYQNQIDKIDNALANWKRKREHSNDIVDICDSEEE